MPRSIKFDSQELPVRALSADFRTVFAENTENTHLLSFILTADHAKANECCVSGLDSYAEGSSVFRDWTRRWTRRTIIRNAVRVLAPRRDHSSVFSESSDPTSFECGGATDADDVFASIVDLADFERFIFVMSVLEGYSDQDCSVLLGCSEQDVRETRVKALQHVAKSYSLRTTTSATDELGLEIWRPHRGEESF